MKNKLKFLGSCLLLAGLLSFLPPVNAAPGGLDTTFSQDGKLYDFFTSRGIDDVAYGTAVQPDGKIIAAGKTYFGSIETCGVARYNADGTLDPTFDGDGKAVFTTGKKITCRAAAVQSDGKIVTVGYTLNGANNTDFAVIRFNADGSTDASFGSNGIVTTNLGAYNDLASAVAIQSDGKIVVVGSAYSIDSSYDFAVVRYNPNGSIDSSFNGGIVTTVITSGSTDERANAVAIQPDGKIVVAGSASGFGYGIIRYNSNGLIDITFNSIGIATTRIENTDYDVAYSVAVQPDGKIVAAGTSDRHTGTFPNTTAHRDFSMVRYNANGSLDTSFDSDGKVLVPIDTTREQANAVAIQADGKIVLTGYSHGELERGNLAILRFNTNGSLDSSFFNSGVIFTQAADGSSQGNALAIQPDGKIIAAGEGNFGTSDFILVRYNTDGSLDTSFSSDGKVNNSVGFAGSSARAVAIQPNGKIVVAGRSSPYTPDFTVSRYNADGSPDTTFDGDGKAVTPLTERADNANAIAIQADGKILVAGTIPNITNPDQETDAAVVRYNADGSLDTSFNGFGQVIINVGLFESINAIVVQPDGKIVIAGSITRIGEDGNIILHRLNPNGSFDNSFGTNGSAIISGLTSDYAFGIALQADGKIVAVGQYGNGQGNYDIAVVRLTGSGAPDTTFGSNGIVTTQVYYRHDGANAVAIQPDGKIVIAGYSETDAFNNFLLIRYNTNGSLDTSFDSDGIFVTSMSDYGASQATSIAIQPNGKIIAAGYALNGVRNNDFAMIRCNPNGSLDATFDGDGKAVFDFWGSSDDLLYGMALDSSGRAIVAGEASGNFAVARVFGDFVPSAKPPYDYDGDGKTDIGVFRSTSAEWWINRSSTNTTLAAQFGESTDKITSGDFTGDGKADIAIFRPSNGFWYIVRSDDFSFYGFPLGGASGDIPVSADFDGDGKADAAIFRASNSGWYIQQSSGGIFSMTFGGSGDVPVVADYDGDGKADIAITRLNNGNREWWIRRSSDGQIFSTVFGVTGDRAVQGDYTGDGKADIALFRPSNGYWYILRSEDFSFYAFPFGTSGDIPTPGDYDGDGKFDAGVFRSSNSGWYQLRSTQGFTGITYGLPSDTPISSISVP